MREILETHITHSPFKGAWILQTSIDSLLSDLKQEILGKLPKEKSCGKDVLGCVRCGSCDINSFNDCLAQVRKIVEEL